MASPNKEGRILERLAVIEEQIATGFKGVHERQNVTNGRIAKNESVINELQRVDIDLKNRIMNHEERSAERKAGYEDKEIDLEKRVKRLEIVFYAGLGIVGALEFYVRVLKDLL